MGTDGLAWLGAFAGVTGALTGGLALAFEAWREWRERGRIKLSIWVSDLGDFEDGRFKTELSVLCGRAVNTGRRPVRLTQIAVVLGNNRFSMLDPRTPERPEYSMPRFPCTLEEGATVDFRMPVEMFERGAASVVAVDTLHRHWRVPRKMFRAARLSAAKKDPAGDAV